MRRILIAAFAAALFAASAFTQNAQANGIVATWPVGHQPFGMAIDPSDGRVFVSNVDQTRPTLEVLDDRDLSLVSEVAIPKPIRWGLAVDAARHYVYLNGSDPAGPPFANSAFYVLDPSSLAVIQTTALSGY